MISLLGYFNNFLNNLTMSKLPALAYSQHTSQINPSIKINISIEIILLLSSKPWRSPPFHLEYN